jgi:hypothetical protein
MSKVKLVVFAPWVTNETKSNASFFCRTNQGTKTSVAPVAVVVYFCEWHR